MIIGDVVTHSHYNRSELYNPAFTTEFQGGQVHDETGSHQLHRTGKQTEPVGESAFASGRHRRGKHSFGKEYAGKQWSSASYLFSS